MKVNQIIGEHKKGVRAKKYARKPKKYIEPIKPQGPVGPEGAEDAKKKINENISIGGKSINLSSLEVDNVDTRDYPDFSDAYFSYGEFDDGTPLSDEQLELLSDKRGDLVNQLAHDNAIDQGTSYADSLDETGETTMSQGKITANDGKTITVAMPDGTQIQKPIANAVGHDEQGNPVFNVMSTQTGPAGQPQQDPAQQIAQGKNIEINTGAPVEEDNTQPTFGSPEWIEAVKNGTIKLQAAQMPTLNTPTLPNPAEDAYQKKVDAAMQARAKANPIKPVPMPVMKESDKELLDKMLTIAGLR